MKARGMSITDYLETPVARIIINVALIAMLLAIGFFIVRKFRDRIDEDIPDVDEHLVNFEEMHSRGDISAPELRSISTVIEDSRPEEETEPEEPGE